MPPDPQDALAPSEMTQSPDSSRTSLDVDLRRADLRIDDVQPMRLRLVAKRVDERG